MTAFQTLQRNFVSEGKLIQSQMETIIHECKHNHKRIVFIEGSTKFFGKRYASYGNKVLRYETGKEVIIE